LFQFPKGSVVVFDKGYNCYKWHNTLTESVFFVTRIRGNARYRILERRPVNKNGGITSDQTIEYNSVRSSKKSLQPVRRVGYRDPKTGKHYVFITNQFSWAPKMIADIYKQRWQVELLFKLIKQNLKVKAFLSASENAVISLVMAALCVYLLLAYLTFQSHITRSLRRITRLLQRNLFTRRSLLVYCIPPIGLNIHHRSYDWGWSGIKWNSSGSDLFLWSIYKHNLNVVR